MNCNNDTQKKYLLPLRHGKIIDLRTLEIRNKNDNDSFNFELPHAFIQDFIPKNIDDFFRKFLVKPSEVEPSEVELQSDGDEIEYLQMALGHCMTGSITHHSMKNIIIFLGGESSGISIICNLLQNILTNNLCAVNSDDIFFKRTHDDNIYENVDNKFEILINKRVFFWKVNNFDNSNSAIFKELTGGDQMFLIINDEPELVTFESKFIIICKSISDNFDPGFLRRCICIHFTDSVNELDCVPDINANELFTWLCIGANKIYGEKNIKAPKSIIDATQLLSKNNEYNRKINKQR